MPKILKHYTQLQEKLSKVEVLAISGYENKLSKEDNLNKALMEIKNIITKYVSICGGKLGENPVTDGKIILDSCIVSVTDNWMHYGVNDFQAAFEMWSNGNFLKEESVIMYYNVFNLMTFNSILQLYEKRRKSIINEFSERINLEKKAEEIKEKELQYQEFNSSYTDEDLINDAKKYDSYEKFPLFIAHLIYKRKIIVLSEDEITSFRERALILAKREATLESKDKLPTKLNKLTIKELQKNLFERTRVIALKLSIIEKLKTLNNA